MPSAAATRNFDLRSRICGGPCRQYALSSLEVTGFASSFDEPARVREVWDTTCQRSPLLTTLRKCKDCEITMRLALR